MIFARRAASFVAITLLAGTTGCADAPGDSEGAPAASEGVPAAGAPAGGESRLVTLPVHPRGAALSPDGSRLAVTAGDELHVFDLESGALERAGFEGPVPATGGERQRAPVQVWWTADDVVWAQYDAGIRGYDPETGAVKAEALFPVLSGITAHDVARDGSRVFMGQGMHDFFVIHDVAAAATERIDFAIESASGMVGAQGGAFTADGEYLSVRFGDGVRYFRADGTEIEDAAAEFAGTAYAQAVERGRTFGPIGSPTASRRCFDDGGTIYCGADGDFQEVFTWSQESPDGAVDDIARTVSADATTAADVFLLEDGSAAVRLWDVAGR
jgi:hypothetical protein